MTRDEVIETMGEPRSVAAKGNQEIMHYEGGIVIKLLNNKVRRIRGTDYLIERPRAASEVSEMVEPQAVEEPIIEAPEPEPEPVAIEEAVLTESQTNETPVPIVAPEKVAVPTPEPKPTVKEVEQEEFYEGYDEEDYEPTSPSVAFLIELAIMFGIKLIVLKISFERAGFPSFLGGLAVISLLTALFSIGYDRLTAESMFLNSVYLKQGLSYILLAFLIYKFSPVSTGITALKIAAIAMIVGFFAMLIALVLLSIVGLRLS